MAKTQKYGYISLLKGLACIFMMLSHYLSIIRFSESCFTGSLIYRFLHTPFAFMFVAEFWLYLFLVISGFLVGHSSVTKFKELISRCFRRFLRFALPVFFACIFIYLLQITVGFHNQDTASIFQNPWYQNKYSDTLNIKDALLSPFYVLLLGDVSINSPYWVLRHMLIGSCFIYLGSFLRYKFKAKTKFYPFIDVASLLVSFLVSHVVFSCVFGALIASYLHIFEKAIKKYRYFFFLLLGISFIAHLITMHYIPLLFVFFVLIITLHYYDSTSWNHFAIHYFDNISFGVYSFHWPVICSLGAYFITNNSNPSIYCTVFSAFGISIVFTVIISTIFHFTAEKLSAFIIKSLPACL